MNHKEGKPEGNQTTSSPSAAADSLKELLYSLRCMELDTSEEAAAVTQEKSTK